MKKLLLILSLCSNLCYAGKLGDSLALQPSVREFEPLDPALEGRMVPAFGQYDVHSSLLVGVGRGKQRDTYLTNLLYQGRSIDVTYSRSRLLTNFWTTHHELEASYMNGEDKAAGLSNVLVGRVRYKFEYGKYLFNFIGVAPYASVDAGFNYNLKLASGNNPATARIVGNMGVSLSKGWNYRIRKQNCGISLSASAPLLGAAFVPEYGASYYETFYLDHTDHDVHFTSLHNQQDLDVKLMTSLPASLVPIWKKYTTRLNLGVKYHIETMDINNIVTRYSSFQFVVGWSWQYYPRYRQ